MKLPHSEERAAPPDQGPAIGRRHLLQAAGGGLALLFARGTAAADWNEAEKANVKTVTEFCAAWATRDLARVLPFLADDCVYRMTETALPVSGHGGVTERLKAWLDDSSLVEFRVLDTAAAGPIVINHRIDRFVGPRRLTWEGVGVFFLKDGKIREWSDYTIRSQRPQ
jgi:limonene-1,2-epoxide hydrolase